MKELTQFREELNRIDAQIILLLGDRFKIIHAVGKYKKIHHIPMMQPDRVQEVKMRCTEIGSNYGLEHGFIDRLYDLIISEACKVENSIIDGN